MSPELHRAGQLALLASLSSMLVVPPRSCSHWALWIIWSQQVMIQKSLPAELQPK